MIHYGFFRHLYYYFTLILPFPEDITFPISLIRSLYCAIPLSPPPSLCISSPPHSKKPSPP